MVKKAITSWLATLVLVLVLASWGASDVGHAKPPGGPHDDAEGVGAPCGTKQSTVGADPGAPGAPGKDPDCVGGLKTSDTIHVPCSTASLTAAINAANSAEGTPTLTLAARCTYDINTGLPTITGSMVMVGGPSTVIRRNQAAAAFRILEVAATGSLAIQGIFIVGGAPAAGQPGGGIQNNGSLRLQSVTMTGNTATGATGGGLNNTGQAIVSRTVVSHNSVSGAGSGGGISNFGSLTVSESILELNATSGGDGGGLVTESGATTRLLQTTVRLNTASGNGGGIASLGTTSLYRTLVQDNTATVSGGGIYAPTTPVQVPLTTSVIRGNIPTNCAPTGAIPECHN